MPRPDFTRARILIVDDEVAYVDLLRRYLETIGYRELRTTTNPAEVAEIVIEFDPDLILLDLRMRGMDGIAVMQQLEPYTSRFYLPILVLTGDISAEAKRASLSSGARDFLNKPFDLTEVRLRIENLLETRFLHLELQERNVQLERHVEERVNELEDTRVELLARLAAVADYRDDPTGLNTQRVSRLSGALAAALGLDAAESETIRLASALHDIGKVGIPDAILLKPGPLDEAEAARMRTHTLIGAKMLSGSRSRLLHVAEAMALGHHERWDGGGYPRGLHAGDIPVAARIVALADVFDALASDRPYRRAWPLARIRDEIEQQAGRQFDPDVARAFLRLVDASHPAVAMD